MLLVIPNDMLYKVDSMSMAHALEVRTPFLDQHLVKHAFKLPVMFKVNHTTICPDAAMNSVSTPHTDGSKYLEPMKEKVRP